VRNQAALLVAALALASPVAGRAQDSTGVLEGAVTAADTRAAVPLATVLIRETLLSTQTDSRGAYRIRDIPPGTYSVRVTVLGFHPRTDTVVITAGAATKHDVALERAVVSLPGVVVTANRTAGRPEDTPASVAVLPAQEITQRVSNGVEDALPYVPGITFNNSSYNNSTLDIRGSSGVSRGVGSRVLMLLDGHPMLTGDGGEIDFYALPLLDVDQVEVVKGAYSAVYGGNALGGVVNVLTKPIDDFAQTLIRAFFGAYDTPEQYRFTQDFQSFQGIDLQHSQRFGDVGTRFVLDRWGNDGYEQNGWYQRWFARARIDFPEHSDHPASVFANWSLSNEGDFFTWESDSLPYNVPSSQVGNRARSERWNLGGTFTPIATSSQRLQVAPYYYWNWDQNFAKDSAGNDTVNYHRAGRLGADVNYIVSDWHGQSLTMGGEAAWTRVHSNFIAVADLYDFAVYGEDNFGPASKRWNGSVGIRFDSHTAQGTADEFSVSPKVGLSFRVSQRVTLRGSIGHGFRAPSAIEQFINTEQYGYTVKPNPDLQPETAWSGEIGATSTFGRLWVDGAIFTSNYDGLIAPGPAGEFAFQFVNVTHARVSGLDFATKLGVLPGRVDVALTYMLLDAKDLTTGEWLPYRSRNNLTGTLDLWSGLFGVDVTYRSRVETVVAFPLDPRTAITVLNLRTGYKFKNTLLQAKLSNALQAHYVDVQERSAGAPRSFLLSATQSF